MSPSLFVRRASISRSTPDPATGKTASTAKLIPNRGAWLEFETSNRDVVSVKVDRKRKMPVSILLRAIGLESDDQLREAFADVDTNEDRRYIQTTLEKETTKTHDEALIELYRRLRPGDPPTRDNASQMLENLFFNDRRYDLARVGRYKLNGVCIATIGTDREIERPNSDCRGSDRDHPRDDSDEQWPSAKADDIDHLGNRRIRAVGELIQMHVRTGFQRLERGIRERMTIHDPETVTPQGLISTTRPVMAAVREFFGGSRSCRSSWIRPIRWPN